MLLLAGVLAIVVGAKLALAARALGKRWQHFAILPVAGVAMAAFGVPRGVLLSKSIGLCAMPLGLVWLALLTLTLIAWWRARRREAITLAAIWLAITLAANAPLASAMMRAVEGDYASAPSLSRDARFDAVIVLGGGTAPRAHREVELGTSGDRVMLGARLYRTGATPILVTSGSPMAGLTSHDSARAAERMWRELGIPADAIVRVDGARTTSEEAHLHAALIRERGWRRVGLVTSAFHMTRALGLFEREHARVIPIAADVRSEPIEWHGFMSVIPQAPAADELHTACWELVGRLAGR